ncbi:XAP5, circadian clock regulator-domain-containing protein [Coniochaeta sp. 2T2.1]|nr:XAP5, circadian clock regulator-domain-containing protein [Coniochaeta sp. 2T2.1]
MSDAQPSRFTSSNKTTHERLTSTTVGLVALSDFRKRRAEVLEQQEREAREAALAVTNATSTPDRSLNATPNNATSDQSEPEKHAKKKKKKRKVLLSFGDDEAAEDDGDVKADKKKNAETASETESDAGRDKKAAGAKVINSSVAVVPRALTKAALRREAAERDALRKQFLLLQAAVKATEIAIPFVFYDGTNIPGGIVRVKKGDFIWVFLDKSRKVGADLGVGGEKTANVRREWARVGVDDLMLVRGTIIIPHHYEFYFFIMNKTLGPGNKRLFDYSAEAPSAKEADKPAAGMSVPSKSGDKDLTDLSTLEGSNDDPTYTKVVDRRWFERNKHIYPASVWQEFDPEKDYQNEIRRDLGGNTFFFSK